MKYTKIFGDHEDNTLEQLRDVASRAEMSALMADGHLGYIMPIGGVTAYEDRVSIAGVGYDIGCGNAAIKTDMTMESLCGVSVDDLDTNPYRVRSNPTLNELADEIFNRISFGRQLYNLEPDAPVDHELFHDHAWWAIPNTGAQLAYRDELMEKARKQLGTVGGGNHYVDVFVDDDDVLWVGVHFGSRGFGHTVASDFLALSAGEAWGARVKEHEGLVHLDNPIGHDYWQLMVLAGRYAYAGRNWTSRKVVDIIGAKEVDMVHNNHNFAWKEEHLGRELSVVRKGATPARPAQRGFVGGSMCEDAVIVEGASNEEGSREHWLQEQALFSTVHGAGRVMGRRQAKRTLDQLDVDRWIEGAGVIVRGGGLDEAPQAYKRLPDVLEHHGSTIKVTDVLHPIIVCMASD